MATEVLEEEEEEEEEKVQGESCNPTGDVEEEEEVDEDETGD